MKKHMIRRKINIALLMLLLVFGLGSSVRAEEDWYEEDASYEEDSGEEEEFIPETYYDPIQTNEIPGWPQGQAIQAASGIVMDMDTGTILYGKNIEDTHYPASITKIMTTMIALERGDLDDVITCGDEVYDIEANSTHLGIQPGEELTLREALYGLMLESANDLGNAIAVHIAGSVEAFADLMNEKALSLGCEHTHFTNPHGLHNENHYTCAHDMALIARAAFRNKTFRRITGTEEYSIGPTNLTEEERPFANHQRLLRTDSDYYQPWCIGGKTGFTTDAWNTLVTYAKQDGMRLVCVLMRENGADRSYLETTDLIEYAFANFRRVSPVTDTDVPTFYELMHLNYPGSSDTVYQEEAFKQPVYEETAKGKVTLPAGASVSELTRQMTDPASGDFQYLYNGWPVGTGNVKFAPLPKTEPLAFEQYRDVEQLMKDSEYSRVKRSVEQTAGKLIDTIKTVTTSTYEKAKDYVDNNRMTVLLIGAFVLLILVILIIILILRCTKEYRIRRHRRAEEKLRRRSEEEIDQKSAVEIEEELRRAMAEEAARKAREEKRRREQQLAEEQLRETERIIEEIRETHNT